MPKRKAIIHIGTAKTGSTTIQRLLAGNREALIADGFAYPRAPGRNNHIRLAACGADPRQASRIVKLLGEKDDVAAVLGRLHDDLDAEFAALPDSVHTVIFSNEHCYSKINSPEAAERLQRFLSPWFDAFQILVYLRRQDEFAVSRYSTRLRAGGFEVSVLPAANEEFNADDDDEDGADEVEADASLPGATTQPISRMLDWSNMLDTWAAVFGKAALRPRIFERREFVNQDLVLDFLHCCGLPERYAKDARSHNASMRPEAQEFLRRYNEARHRAALAAGTKAGKVPSEIKGGLARDYTGNGRMPLRSDAEAFVARFAEANERLRANYFPERERVFSTDFSKYPTEAEPMPSDAAVLDVALHLMLGGKAATPGPAEEAYLRGEQFLKANRTSKAAEAFREALAHDPRFNKARRALRGIERAAREKAAGSDPADDVAAAPAPEERAPVAPTPAVEERAPVSPAPVVADGAVPGQPEAAETAAAPKQKLTEEERAARHARREERQRKREAREKAKA